MNKLNRQSSISHPCLFRRFVQVGAAIRDFGVPREEVFVTTKLLSRDHGYDKALAAFDESNKKLGLGYIDMYLMYVDLYACV